MKPAAWAWGSWAALVLCLVSASAAAEWPSGVVRDAQRARIDYMLQCQGCHLPDGRGIPGAVPSLQGVPGIFVQQPEGRSFLVRVPGSANADLDDAALADLLNWILVTMSAETLPEAWVPYTSDEVGALRSAPLDEITRSRAAALTGLSADR